MRILYMGNNWLGLEILRWLKDQGENIVGLVLHPAEHQKFKQEIIQTVEIDRSCIFDASRLRKPNVYEAVKALEPDIGLSILLGYILKPRFIDLFPAGCINLHPALLPFNRGGYPNVWSIIEGTPSGATLHYIDSGIDTGDIIAQQEVSSEPIDTGKTLYWKLMKASKNLFMKTWPQIKSGKVRVSEKKREQGTYHIDKDVERIDHIDLESTYIARELINILRARTFAPYPGAYFVHEGQKVHLRLQLIYEEDLENLGKDS